MAHGEPSSLKDGSALNIRESFKPRVGAHCLKYAVKEIMKSIARITSVLLLVGFANACASEQPNSLKTPWDKWYFAFTTPKSLPAQVTLLKLLDVDGYASTYRTIDQPQGSV